MSGKCALYVPYDKDVCWYLKFCIKIFHKGEGNCKIRCIWVKLKLAWGISLKDFQNRKNCSANFLQWGEACVVPFVLFILGFWQTSSDRVRSRQLETSASLHLKTRASRINWTN